MTTKRKDIIHSDPEILGGTPVFVGTRVPVQNLIDYLRGGDSLEQSWRDHVLESDSQDLGDLDVRGRVRCEV